MSYCRMGEDSDVYVYGSCDALECCGCFHTTSRKEMLNHLMAHAEKGDMVPIQALTRLREEIDSEGDEHRTVECAPRITYETCKQCNDKGINGWTLCDCITINAERVALYRVSLDGKIEQIDLQDDDNPEYWDAHLGFSGFGYNDLLCFYFKGKQMPDKIKYMKHIASLFKKNNINTDDDIKSYVIKYLERENNGQ